MSKNSIKIRKFEAKDQADVYDIWAYSSLVEYPEKFFWNFIKRDRIICVFLQVIITCYILELNAAIWGVLNMLVLGIVYWMCKYFFDQLLRFFDQFLRF